MSRALADALRKLLARQDAAPASLFTDSQRVALDVLASGTGFLTARAHGRGVVYQINNRAGLAVHLRTLRPETVDSIAPTLPARAASIATHRDSKANRVPHDLYYLVLKAVGDGVCWSHDDDRILDLSGSTRSAEAGALAIREDDRWKSDRPLWLVENQAPFDDTSWLPDDTRASVAYYAGQIPARLLAWLAHRPRVPEVILFADYDGVGLQNFVRLREQLKTSCEFWLMPNWHATLRKYGNNTIWQNTQREFSAATARLAELHPSVELLELCALMSREGLALEHEAVWLDRG